MSHAEAACAGLPGPPLCLYCSSYTLQSAMDNGCTLLITKAPCLSPMVFLAEKVRLFQVYASYNYRRDLTAVVKVPGMLSRARSLRRQEAEAQEADVGKGDAGVSLHPPTMRQAIAWELAMRNIRQSEVRRRSTAAS